MSKFKFFKLAALVFLISNFAYSMEEVKYKQFSSISKLASHVLKKVDEILKDPEVKKENYRKFR